MSCNKCRSRSKSPPPKRTRHQPAAKGRQASLSSTTSSSSPSPARRHRRYSSSFSPVKRTDRHSHHSPSHSRQRSRRSPSPRGKSRRGLSPGGKGRKGRADRGSSLLPKSRRGSPSRGRPPNRARGASPPSRPRSARSPVGRPRQRGKAPVGGSTTPSTSRSPSPYRRRLSHGHPPRAKADQQKANSSPLKQGKGAASASQPAVATAVRRSQERSPERSARLPAAHASKDKPHGSTAVPSVTDVPVPPPPVPTAPIQLRPSTSAAQVLPPLPDDHAAPQMQPGTSVAQALPPPPADGHGVSQQPTNSVQAEQPGMRARRVFADQKKAPQGYNPAHAAVASKTTVMQSNITGSTVAQQQRPAGHASSTSTTAAVDRPTLAGAQASDPSLTPPSVPDAAKQLQPSTSAAKTEPQPVDPSAAPAPAKAQADTPEHSFDGRQSFISLDVDDAPAGGAASVDQPSPASRKTKLNPPVLSDATAKAVSAQLPAASQTADKAQPAVVMDAARASQQQDRQQQAAASAINSAADMQADKHNIKPDLFTASRPSSAVSPGTGTLKFDADQKQLPAAKSKVAHKGSIQIVLATKHKQVQMLYCHARIICAQFLLLLRQTICDQILSCWVLLLCMLIGHAVSVPFMMTAHLGICPCLCSQQQKNYKLISLALACAANRRIINSSLWQLCLLQSFNLSSSQLQCVKAFHIMSCSRQSCFPDIGDVSSLLTALC